MKRVNYSISTVTISQLDELKEKTGCTKSELIRRAVAELWERVIEMKREGK